MSDRPDGPRSLNDTWYGGVLGARFPHVGGLSQIGTPTLTCRAILLFGAILRDLGAKECPCGRG